LQHFPEKLRKKRRVERGKLRQKYEFFVSCGCKNIHFDFVGCLFLLTFAPFNNNLIVFMSLKK